MSNKQIDFVSESEIPDVKSATSEAPDVHKLKQGRSIAKRNLTIKRNEIENNIEEFENTNEAKDKIKELELALDGLKKAHLLYHGTLQAEEDIQDSNDYFNFEVMKINKVISRIHSYMNLQDNTPRTHVPCPTAAELNNVDPLDSISVCSKQSMVSKTSKASSARIKASARKAKLQAESEHLKRLQELQQQELRLQQEKAKLKLDTELAIAHAEESALVEAEMEGKSTTQFPAPHLIERLTVQRPPPALTDSRKPSGELNPDAQSNKQETPKPPRPLRNEETPIYQPAAAYTCQSTPYLTQTTPFATAQHTPFMQQMENLLVQQQQHTLALMLPQPELPVFDGNPIEYCSFIRAFESIIESRTANSSAKLYYLIQYTSGDVNELMRSCLNMKANEGYQEARRLLKERFGQDYKIATAYVNRITEGPPLRAERADELRKFSVLITSCKNALKDVGYLNRINNPDTLKKIVDRLPFDMRRRWRDIADDISESQQRDITIEDVAKFVEKKARSSSHPVFGDISTPGNGKPERPSRNTGRSGKGTSFGTTTGSMERDIQGASRKRLECPLCSKEHWLSQCSEFRSKSLEERGKIVKTKGICNNCLVKGHMAKDCPKESFCRVDGCTTKHSTFLHPPTDKSASKQERERESEGDVPKQASSANGYIKARSSDHANVHRATTSLAILPVKVKVPGTDRVVVTNAFLDTGSDTTFITEELRKELKDKGKEYTLSLTTLVSQDQDTKTSVHCLQVSDLNENNVIELPCVFATPQLPVTTENRARSKDIRKWPHLQGINITDLDAKVGLLIGSNVPRALEPKEVKSGQPGQPYATRTELGWVVNGPLDKAGSARRTVNLIRKDAHLSHQFEEFCNMEFSDSIYQADVAMSQDDKRALQQMKFSIQLVDGHYQIGLPWRKKSSDLPNNRQMAELRLEHLRKRLAKEPILLGRYTVFMNDLLDKGFARRYPQDADSNQVTWFLPHHPVFNPRKPEKTRVVFDCSAKYRNASLNGQLLQGPDLTSSLVGVLTRFRTETVALNADIEGMFLQVRVPPEDANALRFLWWPEGDLQSDPEEYQMLVHLFGAASSPSCANFALRQTAEDNKEDFDPDTVNTVKRNFYVDDCLKSVKSKEKAIQLQGELRQLLSRGGFRLTKFMSNSREVLQAIPESERAQSVKDLDFGNSTVERALGVRWDVTNDKFGFKFAVKGKQPTRRGILSIVSSIYDPLGFVSPFILPAKAILQDLCRQKLGWDVDIAGEDLKRWHEWLCELPKLEDLVIDRFVKPNGFGDVTNSQLHHFSDASQMGYGAVSYLRITNSEGRIHCSFIMGKSRLAPIKATTIPRLELSAAVISTRLDTMIRQEIDLEIDESYFWTDSTCVLRYIENNGKRFQTFVANRVAAIRDLSTPSQWRYVDTDSNPADYASRGLKAEQLVETNCWIQGPEFLLHPDETWPKRPESMGEITEEDPEIKKEAKSFAVETLAESQSIQHLFRRFSSWSILRKSIAWLLRYKTNLRAAQRKRQTGESIEYGELQPIQLRELQNAEKEILRHIQRESFPSEVKNLKNADDSTERKRQRNPVGKTSRLQQLDPFMADDGLVRVGGRLGRAPISDEMRHQVILPQRHHVVDLLVRHYHQSTAHSGLEYVLSAMRSRYWIIKGRPTIRRILSTCFNCRRRQAPVQQQKMAHLPENRVTPSKPPFTFVGVDCFGPFQVRRGRATAKRYGVLFTCLSIRAVHIEVVHSLDTPSFINALRRFIARRGHPKEMRSDNGGNFVKGNKELAEAIANWNQSMITEYLQQRSIEWTFNPPAGSHHGGVWERCIRTVRKIMNALLKEQTMDDEGLATLMCEVEAIINGRPITKVSDDPNDCEALTPNHLLLLRAGPTLPPGLFSKDDCYSRRRWRQVQYLANVFWRRWLREYLPTLQQRQKWYTSRRNLKVNDIVIVVDDNAPRSSWPLGRITEVRESSQDGCVRSVKVKTRASHLERPVDKIVLLEGCDVTDEQSG